MKKIMKAIVVLAAAAVAVFVLYRFYPAIFGASTKVVFSTSQVARGRMQSTISATGTVEPEELVNVGAQVGGMITTLGVDTDGNTVDYRSEVTEGMVLANIDDALYKAAADNAAAQKSQAAAQVDSALANIELAKAKLELAAANWERAQQLNPKNVIAKSEYDSSKAEYFTALANVAAEEAALLQARAQLAAAEAQLDSAMWNLKYCVISSPVDGVIIDRRVNVGQTVNSSMSAPSLFLIAKDLKRMQVWVSVNEADVGQIVPGQEAEFTVDAFGSRIFKGTVKKVRLNATMSQNVVTYVAEIDTDNSDGTLLPYLTANVNFILASRDDALTVPNSAFRFVPEVEQVPEKYLSAAENLKANEKLLWTLEDGALKPVPVVTGLNDGSNTEILSGVPEGTVVVTGSKVVSDNEEKEETATTNPFLPKIPRRGNRK